MNKKRLAINIVGGLAVVGLVIFPNPNELTTWQSVIEQAKNFISNPYQIGLAIMGAYGYVTNLK